MRHLTTDDFPTGSVYNKAAAPVAGDDVNDGYNIGNLWIDTTNNKSYICLDNAAGAAVWKEITVETVNGANKFHISWTLSGISSTTSTSFTQVPEQIHVPMASDLISGATTISAVMEVSTNITGSATGEFDLFNYTDFVQEGLVTALPNGGWTETNSAPANIAGGKSYRARIRRVGGGGSNQVQIEGASLTLTIT